MLVIAHRGASGHAPEHTFAAYDLALELGCDLLEQDLQLTRDGVLVCVHDETLDRTATDWRGRIIDHEWAEIRDCDVGSWFNRAYPGRARSEYSGARIPTLDEVLERYRDRTAFYIETKRPEEAPGMEAALLALLEKHGLVEPARRHWHVLIQSFSAASLRLIHELDPELPLIQLVHARTGSAGIEAMLPHIAEYAVGIGPERRDVDASLVESTHRLGLHVHPYTVNDESEMRRLTEAGVDGMFTNFTDRLLALRPADEARGLQAVRRAAREHTPRKTSRSGTEPEGPGS